MLTAVPPGAFGDVYPKFQADGVTAGYPQGLGFQPGDVAQVANSDRFAMFVQNNPSGSTITANQALIWTATTSNSNVPTYIVDAAPVGTNAGDKLVIGVNDLAGLTGLVTGASIGGASVTIGKYFWMTTKGWCYPLVAQSTTALVYVGSPASTGAAGVLSALGSNDDLQTQIQAVAGTPGSGGNQISLCYMKG